MSGTRSEGVLQEDSQHNNLKEEYRMNLNEELLQQAMNDTSIGGPDPNSQKAIDRLPESQRQRYNEATKKKCEGMQKKDVMDFVRINSSAIEGNARM